VIDSITSYNAEPARDDLDEQLSRLITPTFLVDAPVSWLFQFPRYLEAMKHRGTKLASGAHAKDAEAMATVKPWSDLVFMQLDKHRAAKHHNAHLEHVRWMLEEFRVQVFAQHLRVAVPVSDKKLREIWDGYRRSLG
jgi:ATP-dependent helicase HrpA